MSAEVSTVTLPDNIVRAAEVQARLSGLTLEQWLSRAVASHLDTDEGAREFFRQRARNARPENIQKLFDSLPDVPPMPGDELE